MCVHYFVYACAGSTVATTKSSRLSDINTRRREVSLQVHRWGTQHRARSTNLDNQFHQISIPTSWFVKVPDNMSARPITEASVQMVYENIMNLGVQESRVVFFVFLENLQAVGYRFVRYCVRHCLHPSRWYRYGTAVPWVTFLPYMWATHLRGLHKTPRQKTQL